MSIRVRSTRLNKFDLEQAGVIEQESAEEERKRRLKLDDTSFYKAQLDAETKGTLYHPTKHRPLGPGKRRARSRVRERPAKKIATGSANDDVPLQQEVPAGTKKDEDAMDTEESKHAEQAPLEQSKAAQQSDEVSASLSDVDLALLESELDKLDDLLGFQRENEEELKEALQKENSVEEESISLSEQLQALRVESHLDAAITNETI